MQQKPWLNYSADELIEQHKQRLNYMPWLYRSLKPKQLAWARPWQQAIQAKLMAFENIELGDEGFIAQSAKLFAEPGRSLRFGARFGIAADSFIHGPAQFGDDVGINHGCSIDGGSAGLVVGDGTRIGPGCRIYAFNHGMQADAPIFSQNVRSRGIVIGKDVWLGANVGICDGVVIGDHAVIGMGAVISKSVAAYAIMAGNPAKQVGDRRERKE